jgi:molybdopterin converting factor small subunit
MEIEVKLFGNVEQYRPEGADRLSFKMSTDEGSTVQQLIRDLAIPENMHVLAIINGKMSEPGHVLKDGDEATLFSPAGGG